MDSGSTVTPDKRAITVTTFLLSQGVNPALVSAQGFGDSNPVAPNDTPQGRAQNRRVELTSLLRGTDAPLGRGSRVAHSRCRLIRSVV
jgi:OmpA family